MPYLHIALTLDALAATRSRLSKEGVLTEAFVTMLERGSSDSELLAACHLFAPTKDAQTGGHRLLPDWEGGDVLNIGHKSICAAIGEATGSGAQAVRAALDAARDVGDAAVALRDGGGGQRQCLLVKPPPLSVRGVYEALLAIGRIAGADAAKRREGILVRLLRSAHGAELRWVARTLVPHMAAGISLEAKVLPALGAAFALHSRALERGADPRAPPPAADVELAKAVSEAARRCYALCPRVDALIARLRGRAPRALAGGEGSGAADGETMDAPTDAPAGAAGTQPSASATLVRLVRALAAEPAPSQLDDGGMGTCSLDRVGAVQLGSPVQPMLGKPATSVAALVRALAGPDAEHGIAAEFKYDGQRAQVHRLPSGAVRIFSRKLDEITQKYPDVVEAVRRAQSDDACSYICECEIVPVGMELDGGDGVDDGVPAASAPSGQAAPDGGTASSGAARAERMAHESSAGARLRMLAFQALSTRKRSGVTLENSAFGVRVLTVAFDLLSLNGRTLLTHTYAQRRALLRKTFPRARPSHGVDGMAEGERLALAACIDVMPARDAAAADGAEGDGARVAAGIAAAAAACDEMGAASASPGGVSSVESAVGTFLELAIECGAEGLMCKRLDSQYEPDSILRADTWVKLKKDYVDGLGDSLDLVPIGGWRGEGRKKAWVSPWLLACYNPEMQAFESVCRVMSGFTDAFYTENTLAFLGVSDVGQLGRGGSRNEHRAPGGDDDDDDGEGGGGDGGDGDGGGGDGGDGDGGGGDGGDGDGGGDGAARAFDGGWSVGRPDHFATSERCRWWFSPSAKQPLEVWEIRGAELSVSPVHHAATGLIDPQRGLSLRFPRFVRKRPDKGLEGVTTSARLAELYRAQLRQHAQPAPVGVRSRRTLRPRADDNALGFTIAPYSVRRPNLGEGSVDDAVEELDSSDGE